MTTSQSPGRAILPDKIKIFTENVLLPPTDKETHKEHPINLSYSIMSSKLKCPPQQIPFVETWTQVKSVV